MSNFYSNLKVIGGKLIVGTDSIAGLNNNTELVGLTYIEKVGIGNENSEYILSVGQQGNQGGIAIYGTSSGKVYLETKPDAGSWSGTLPDNAGSIPDYIYNNFGGEIMLNDGVGNLYFGTTPSLSLPEGYVFIGNTYSYAVGRTFSGDVTVDYTGTVTINDHVVSYNKMQLVSQKALLGSDNTTGGIVSEIPVEDAYILSGSVSTALENGANWTSNEYTGPSITGTYQGQNHYDSNYLYTAVDDNLWIRLTRG